MIFDMLRYFWRSTNCYRFWHRWRVLWHRLTDDEAFETTLGFWFAQRGK